MTAAEVPHPAAVITTNLALRRLLEDGHMVAAYELVQLCRDPSHELFGESGDILRSLALIDQEGRVHDTVREIVLTALSHQFP